MNDIKRNNDHLQTILEGYAAELSEKAELVRTLGKQLLSFALQGESLHPVEWIVRIGSVGNDGRGDEQSLMQIELTLGDGWLSISAIGGPGGSYPIKPPIALDMRNEETPVPF